ncbi:transposase [Rhodococcus opacus]|uniref:transposase n=1 Tax=Rhodococcus opacus TaxID=37919 RepID=UPI00211EBB97|nr:transposase [Rhodococcus opacus]
MNDAELPNNSSLGDSEDEVFWRGFLTALKKRGLSDVRLVILTSTPAWPRHCGARSRGRGISGVGCISRETCWRMSPSRTPTWLPRFRTSFAQPDPATAASTWDEVRDQLAGRFPKIGPLMDQTKSEVLALRTFPRAHWSKIWSTNPLERVNKGIKRRVRFVGIFPNEAAVIRLVGAVLADMHDE